MGQSHIVKLELEFTKVEIHEHFMISQIKEGIDFKQEHLDQFYKLFEIYYSDKPFVSIADRKYDYTIDPNLLRDSRFKNLLGIGVVCYSEGSYQTALFEKNFFKGPFQPFYSLEDCIEWANTLITSHHRKNKM
jgi:hypothetical protein